MRTSMSGVSRRWAVAFVAASCALGAPLSAQTGGEKAIGLVSKVVLEVSRRAEEADWSPARRGDILDAGSSVRTGERSLAVVKLKDNSLLRIRERSVVIFDATTSQGGFQKGVEMQGGVVGFNVTKQRSGEEFRFVSPTSVASIRGTDGSFTNADTSDIFIILSGLGRLMNRRSLESVDVPAGFIGFSYPDGRLSVRRLTEGERLGASEASGAGPAERRLRIDLKNPKGEKRELILELNEQ
jgi:hypothetical protein